MTKKRFLLVWLTVAILSLILWTAASAILDGR